MKVTLVIESIGSGGAERQITYLAKGLCCSDCDVTLLHYGDSTFHLEELLAHGVKVISGAAKNRVQRFLFLFSYMVQNRPNRVITFLEGPSFYVGLIRMCLKFKFVISERNITVAFTIKQILRYFFLNLADVIVTNSSTQKKLLSRRKWLVRKNVVVIPNFIDLDHFEISTPIIKRSKEILVVARVVKQKNVVEMIRAIALLENKEIVCHWYGHFKKDDDYYRECLDLISELDIKDRFFFKGVSHNMKDVYNQYMFFCLPSLYEGYPNVLLEAMSSGCIVLASNVSDISQIIGDDMDEFLLINKDRIDLKNKINFLYTIDAQRLTQLSIKNRNRAMEKLSLEQFTNEYLDLIK